MLDKLRYLKSIGSDQLIFLMGLFFVILAIMILKYTLKHPRLGAEGKHKIMRIGLFISIAALAFLRSMLYALCDHVKILSTNLQYLEGFAIIFSSKRKEVSYVRLIWKHKQIKKHTF